MPTYSSSLVGPGRRRRASIVAITAVVLLAGVLAPVAQGREVAGGKTFVQSVSVEKHVSGRSHIASMAATAAEAASHPRPAHHRQAPHPKATFPKRATVTPVTARASSTTKKAPAIVSIPDVVGLTAFDGITRSEGGEWTPADPWIAAGPSHLVQIVNDMVRVTNRAGGVLLSVPSEAFFAVEPDLFATDGRIIWDATHGRWVGEVVWFAGDLSFNGFTLAVSDSSDPTQGWSLIGVRFDAFLPDFPSLASSNDKIVVADDLFDSGLNFYGADFNTFTWSSILAGGAINYHFCDPGQFAHPRAAQVLSSSSDIHVVMEETDGSADQVYVRLRGTGQCGEFADFDDLTTDLGFDPLVISGPPGGIAPSPRQIGSDTIDNAPDERITDAVWQSNRLYWVSTYPVTYDLGATWNDQVVVWSTTTATTSGTPSGVGITQVTPGDTIDAYGGGIGLTRNGTPIVIYSQSDASSPIALYANRIDTGGGLGTPLLLDTSEAAINGERWGDYAGVAMDPTGYGTVWASHMLAASDGDWRTDVVRLVVDNDLPTTPGAPLATTLVPSTLMVPPRYRISWTPAVDVSSGNVSYRLEQNVDNLGFAFAATLGATSTVRTLVPGHNYRFRVWAVDALGNAGLAATGPLLTPSIVQSPTSKSRGWHISSSAHYSGGSTRYATAAGAWAQYKSSGVRSLGFVTTKSSTRGKYKIYVDGHLKGTFTAKSSTTGFRQVVYQATWSTAGTHSIKIVVVGTSRHPRVDVDAFLVLK